jgi:hypothetical protein
MKERALPPQVPFPCAIAPRELHMPGEIVQERSFNGHGGRREIWHGQPGERCEHRELHRYAERPDSIETNPARTSVQGSGSCL